MNLIELNQFPGTTTPEWHGRRGSKRVCCKHSRKKVTPIDLISILVSDELACRSKRLLERRSQACAVP